MKKVFGIADSKYAYFYEMDNSKEIDEIIKYVNDTYKIEKKDIVLCDFYDNKVHNYGKYQDDINNGNASVVDVRIMHIDKRTTGLSRINTNPCFGVIELNIVYQSQISKIIKNTFGTEYYSEQYKPIDFTEMMKVVNSIDNIPNTFTYDSVVDKRLRYMNLGFKCNLDEILDINKKQYLNEKEKGMSLDEYYEIISSIADNTKFRLVATYDLNKQYNEEIENMKRYALRNSKLIEMPIFNPILRKLQVPLNTDKDFIKNVSTKKYQYSDRCNVYLQKGSIYGIM